jgi:TonB family protein
MVVLGTPALGDTIMTLKTIAATLLLSPVIAAAAAVPDAKTGAVRISTGVVAPKLIKTVAIPQDTTSAIKSTPAEHEVVVAMVVDETGKPTNLKIVQSSDALLDEHVLSAVQQYRWQPGSVSGQIVAVPVNLHITVQEPR